MNNNYVPIGNNNFGFQMPLGQQSQLQQNQSTNMNFVIVENIQKAKEQVVPYGYTMWMRDSSEPYQYIKSVDSIGTPTFKVLKVEDVTNIIQNTRQQEETIDFISKKDFDELSLKVEQLQLQIMSQNQKPKEKGGDK